jgi:hypothetical protein
MLIVNDYQYNTALMSILSEIRNRPSIDKTIKRWTGKKEQNDIANRRMVICKKLLGLRYGIKKKQKWNFTNIVRPPKVHYKYKINLDKNA